MRHPFLFLLIITFLPGICWGQSFSAESRVDSLGENYYKLSYSFSDTVLTYDEEVLDHGLPFPFFMTTPDDKFTVDSTWINEGRTEFEIFLNTVDSTNYTFISNNVLSKDSLYLKKPAFINFKTYNNSLGEFTITGNYVKHYPIGKTSAAAIQDVGLSALHTTYLIVFDRSIKKTRSYDSLNTSIEKYKPYFYDTVQLSELIGSHAKHIYQLQSWYYENAIIYYDEIKGQSWYAQNPSSPGMYEDIPFSVSSSEGDSLIFLFVDVAYSNEVNFNSVILAHLFEGTELNNITSSISDLYIRTIFPVNIDSNDLEIGTPTKIQLYSYPNPFNPTTQISYTLPEAGDVSISVFNIMGQRVAQLSEGFRSLGAHTTTFNAAGLPAGMYVVRLESTGQSGKVFTETNKVILLK